MTIHTLDRTAVECLSNSDCWELDELGLITPDGAEALMDLSSNAEPLRKKIQFKASSLRSISREACEALVKNFNSIALPGLQSLAPEVAKAFEYRDCNLDLSGLCELSTTAAESPALHRGVLTVRIEESSEALRIIVKHDYMPVVIVGLSRIEVCEASILATMPGVFLPDLTHLTVEAACIISQVPGAVWLRGLTTTEPSVLKKLVEQKGQLAIGLESMDTEAARILATHEGICLDLCRLSRSTVDALQILLNWYRGTLMFNGTDDFPLGFTDLVIRRCGRIEAEEAIRESGGAEAQDFVDRRGNFKRPNGKPPRIVFRNCPQETKERFRVACDDRFINTRGDSGLHI
ncbi:MAG: hypothetical protein KDA88_16950 [Planctomycetaceae bacterium]|nr:hypothetical protein [Planctomycetaceae bacterium]MCB9953567.1 hypothetical protein [Planctomycetaceae bacterium]